MALVGDQTPATTHGGKETETIYKDSMRLNAATSPAGDVAGKRKKAE
jgi:hypothetical protein